MLNKIRIALSLISLVSCLFINNQVGMVLLILLAAWLFPGTHTFMERFGIYISDTVVIIISIIGVIIIALSVVLSGKINEKNTHKHTISDWVYNKESGLEYKKCKSCGEIFEKRVPDIVYSTISPDDEKNTENLEENIEENTEETEEGLTEEQEKQIEKNTEKIKEEFDGEEVEGKIEENIEEEKE